MPLEKRKSVFPALDEDIRNPIWWIASYPKSGNTWLRMFLTAYSTFGRVDINEAGVCTGDQFRPFYQMSVNHPVHEMNQCQLGHVRNAMLVNMMSLYPRRPLYIKTHYVCAMVDDIYTIPPALTMGATYIIRDPRDVCVSYASHLGLSLDKTITTMLDPLHTSGYPPLFAAVSRWDAHVNSWATAKGIKVGVVRYEDILKDPGRSFAKIVRHMEIPLNESHLFYAVGASSFKSLRAQENEAGFRENSKNQKHFFRKGKAGQWKKVLSKKQRGLIEKEFGPTMERFGYL